MRQPFYFLISISFSLYVYYYFAKSKRQTKPKNNANASQIALTESWGIFPLYFLHFSRSTTHKFYSFKSTFLRAFTYAYTHECLPVELNQVSGYLMLMVMIKHRKPYDNMVNSTRRQRCTVHSIPGQGSNHRACNSSASEFLINSPPNMVGYETRPTVKLFFSETNGQQQQQAVRYCAWLRYCLRVLCHFLHATNSILNYGTHQSLVLSTGHEKLSNYCYLIPSLLLLRMESQEKNWVACESASLS